MAKYRTIRWKDQWNLGEPVVWLDVEKADLLWRKDDGFYIPKGAPEHQRRYEQFGKWLLQANRVVWMPTAILFRGRLNFTDGRHRFAWLRDHGAQTIPVTTDATPKFAERLETKLGSALRTTKIERPSQKMNKGI